jgi:hypothetical protein
MQTKMGDAEGLPFFNAETGKLEGDQASKARKLVSLGLVRRAEFKDTFDILPIEGYNTTTYVVSRDGIGWSCTCQWARKGRTCSHQLAVELFIKKGGGTV